MSPRKHSPPSVVTLQGQPPDPSSRGSDSVHEVSEDEEKTIQMQDYVPSRPLTVSIPRGYAPIQGPYCPRRPNLSEILANQSPPPWTLSAFMAYLSQNHCLETLEFTMDASRYRKHYNKIASRGSENPITPGTEECEYVKMLWQRLLEAYIAPNGPREVNLPCDVRDNLLSMANAEVPPHPSTLDTAVSKIYELMEESVLVPFLNSVCPQSASEATYSTSEENLQHTTSLNDHAGGYHSFTSPAPIMSSSAPHRASAPSSLTSPFSRSLHSAAAHARFASGPAATSTSRIPQNSYSSGGSASGSDALTDDSGSTSSPSALDDPMTPPNTPPMTEVQYGFGQPAAHGSTGSTPSPRNHRAEHGTGFATATAHQWKRVSSKLSWKKRGHGGSKGHDDEQPGAYEGGMF